MDIWTLYYGATNHKKPWAVRLFKNSTATETVFEADTREECEGYVFEKYPGAVWLMRMPEDDPVIVGVWL